MSYTAVLIYGNAVPTDLSANLKAARVLGVKLPKIIYMAR